MIRISPVLLGILIALIASCSKAEHDAGAGVEPLGEDEYYYINYNFGKRYFCIPMNDFSGGPILGDNQGPIVERAFTREQALLSEGGLVDRVRFYSGRGSIAVPKGIGQGHGYYLRVLDCSDIFERREIIRGFSAYIKF